MAKAEFKSPLKRSGTKSLFRKASGVKRVGDDALDAVEEQTSQLLVAIATLAGKKAQADDRTTLLPRDIEEAFSEKMASGGKISEDPREFFYALQRMTTDQVVEVIRILTEWTQER